MFPKQIKVIIILHSIHTPVLPYLSAYTQTHTKKKEFEKTRTIKKIKTMKKKKKKNQILAGTIKSCDFG